ncbi:hypothetical protein AAVH_42827 [Aphelenchoides avenae]|nr:hypothetical protein AAVH_42827 [Aphelenchus avenae]
MIFNGTWYCYYLTAATASYDTVANNYCDTFKAGSTIVKALSYREYRYLYSLDTSVVMYVGLIRPTGTTTFTWYDGSAADSLPWAVGRPDTAVAANNLAIVNSDGTITDTDASQMAQLVCRKPAKSVPYDWSSRFW